MLCKELTL